MAVRFHRCSSLWAKSQRHPCWRVQTALDEAGVQYEIVKEVPLLRGRRKAVIAGTGQSKLPAIEREDGSWYRKESAEMAAEIRAGLLSRPAETATPPEAADDATDAPPGGP
jgi:glutathione S-transferase-like protein